VIHAFGTLNASLSSIQPFGHARLTVSKVYLGAEIFDAIQSDFGLSHTGLIGPIVVCKRLRQGANKGHSEVKAR
jgi:hypothetical protein